MSTIPEARLRRLAAKASPPVRRRALGVLRAFMAGGGDGDSLVEFLAWVANAPSVRIWDPDAGAYRRVTLREGQKAVEKQRNQRVRTTSAAVASLLDLYDAPENTLEYEAVFVGPRAEGWSIGRRHRFRETLHAVLDHLQNDPALTSPLGKKLGAKPRSRSGPERILREQYKLGRDSARDLLAALKPAE